MELSRKLLTIKPSATMAITAAAKAMKAAGEDVVGFGAGEPDFDTPEFIKDAAKIALDKGMTKYTDVAGTPALRQEITNLLKRRFGLEYTADQIVVSNGAKHTLTNVFQTILNPGDEVIIPSPYWLSYPVIVEMADGIPVFVEAAEDNEFKVTADQIEAAVNEKTKAIIINSPSNPTGSVYSKEELEKIAAVCKKHQLFIVSDEIYYDLIYDGTHTSIAMVDEETKALTLLVNGLSKSYAMTGWRVGYVACDAQIAKVMKAYQSHTASNANTMAQFASAVALESDGSDIEIMKRAFDERRKRLHLLINDIDGLSCHMPKGAFYIMMNISKTFGKRYKGEEITSSLVFSKLLLDAEKVAVVPGSAFGADEFVRLSYAISMENIDEGLRRIKAFIGALE